MDSRLDVVFPRHGQYYAVVHDSKFSNQKENFYRLKVGSFTYADGMFPLGWQRGAEVEIEVFGGNLRKSLKVRPNLRALDQTDEFASIPIPGQPGSLPHPFVVGDEPEIFEPRADGVRTLRPRTVMNGRILKPGEVDRYSLPVSPGEQWQFELKAASLGTSSLYGRLTVYEPEGKKLASAGDTPSKPRLSSLTSNRTTGLDPYLSLEVPPGVHELLVTVEDLLQRGGPHYGYRLVARRESPDFTLSLSTLYVNIPLQGSAQVTVAAKRRGYEGPIRLSVPNLPDDIVFDGGNIFGEIPGDDGADRLRQGVFTLTPRPGTGSRLIKLVVEGEGVTESGEVIRRRAQGPGLTVRVVGANQRPFEAFWLKHRSASHASQTKPSESRGPHTAMCTSHARHEAPNQMVFRSAGTRHRATGGS